MCEPQCQTFVSSIEKHFQATAGCKEQMQQMCALHVRMCSQWSDCNNRPSQAQLWEILRRTSDGQARIVKTSEFKHLPDIYIDIGTLKSKHTQPHREKVHVHSLQQICARNDHIATMGVWNQAAARHLHRRWNVEEQTQTATPRTSARALFHTCARKFSLKRVQCLKPTLKANVNNTLQCVSHSVKHLCQALKTFSSNC